MKETTMEKNVANSISLHLELSFEVNWHAIYCLLSSCVTKWVRSAKVQSWQGQRDDIIAEIMQEAITRTLRRIHRGKCGELPPVCSIEGLCVKIAHNCFIDLIRRDQRLLLIGSQTSYESQYGPFTLMREAEDFSDTATENVYTATLFRLIVAEVVKFPPKLRTALLIDLACRMSFKGEPTLLQQAFREAGINLEQYRYQLPGDPVGRSRHASLVSLAYKRVAQLADTQEFAISA
jgi:hypothetical protein